MRACIDLVYCSFQVRRTGGTYETHSSFNVRDIFFFFFLYLQRLNIFLITLWTACSVKASLLKQLSLLYFKTPSGSTRLLLFSHTRKNTLQTHLFHRPSNTSFIHILPPSECHLFLHCVCLGLQKTCAFPRFSECYRKKERPSRCIAYTGRNIQ